MPAASHVTASLISATLGNSMRIVSLVPSATEIVASLGLSQYVVGRSHECDYPPEIAHLPPCTSPNFQAGGSSASIDDRVSYLVKSALSIYELDLKLLRALNPSHILTQDRCEVCAVSLGEVEASLSDLGLVQTQVVSLKPKRLDDVWSDIRRIGKALGVDGDSLANNLASRVESIARQSQSAVTPFLKRVVCLEWADPLYCAGGWLPDLVDAAGGTEVIGTAGLDANPIEWSTLTQANPDVIIFAPCGFNIARACDDLSLLRSRSEWQDLRAVKTGEMYVADGNQYFSRPGPRLVESVEILAEILHPEDFNFGLSEKGWTRIESLSNSKPTVTTNPTVVS